MELEFVQTNLGSERTWQRSKVRKTPVIKLKKYDVFSVVDGERVQVGRLWQGLATFERKTPGRTYVNSRWESPRWFSEVVGGRHNAYRSPQETRREAVAKLVWELELQAKEPADT